MFTSWAPILHFCLGSVALAADVNIDRLMREMKLPRHGVRVPRQSSTPQGELPERGSEPNHYYYSGYTRGRAPDQRRQTNVDHR